MSVWINTTSMIERYELTEKNLHVFSHKNKNTDLIKKDGIFVLYNETLLTQMKKKRVKVWNSSHEYYYWLSLEAELRSYVQAKLIFNDTKIGSVASWSDFINKGMWLSIHDESILSINKQRIYINEYCTWCEKHIPNIKASMKKGTWNPSLIKKSFL